MISPVAVAAGYHLVCVLGGSHSERNCQSVGGAGRRAACLFSGHQRAVPMELPVGGMWVYIDAIRTNGLNHEHS
jgi:hypothetical protein